jgi:hypothetical protein
MSRAELQKKVRIRASDTAASAPSACEPTSGSPWWRDILLWNEIVLQSDPSVGLFPERLAGNKPWNKSVLKLAGRPLYDVLVAPPIQVRAARVTQVLVDRVIRVPVVQGASVLVCADNAKV